MSLEILRREIDQIDLEILNKLNRRMELALQTKKFKRNIRDRNREAEILGKVRENAKGLRSVKVGFAERLFSEIIEECRQLQTEGEA